MHIQKRKLHQWRKKKRNWSTDKLTFWKKKSFFPIKNLLNWNLLTKKRKKKKVTTVTPICHNIGLSHNLHELYILLKQKKNKRFCQEVSFSKKNVEGIFNELKTLQNTSKNKPIRQETWWQTFAHQKNFDVKKNDLQLLWALWSKNTKGITKIKAKLNISNFELNQCKQSEMKFLCLHLKSL